MIERREVVWRGEGGMERVDLRREIHGVGADVKRGKRSRLSDYLGQGKGVSEV